MITHLRVDNFKSLKGTDIALSAFQVLVGANAAGKSNLVSSIDFLAKVFQIGLPTAVSTFGGYHNIAFRRMRRSKSGISFTIKLKTTWSPPNAWHDLDEPMVVKLRYAYSFTFKAESESIGSEYKVTGETLSIAVVTGGSQQKFFEYSRDGSNRTAKLVDVPPPFKSFIRQLRLLEQRAQVNTGSDSPLDSAELALTPGQPLSSISFCRPFVDYMSRCRTYQLAPVYARSPASPAPRPEMTRTGEGLAATLYWFQKNDRAAFDRILGHIQTAVPTVSSLEFEYSDSKQIRLLFGEATVGQPWPPSDVSDGTIQAAALFAALLDPRPSLVVIEEPENYLHPWILRSFLTEAIAEAKSKSIMLTTHSPFLVSQLAPKNLLLASRENGRTAIQRASTAFPNLKKSVDSGRRSLGDAWLSGQIRAIPIQLELWDQQPARPSDPDDAE